MEKDFNKDNPENWRLGIFYYNHQDSRFILPKRNAMMGWTFNFAHPICWVFMLLVAAAIVFKNYYSK